MIRPVNRVRAFKPKTKTGCRTCKIRRVKCSEERPSCKKCTSTGRNCDGYDAPGAMVHSSQRSISPARPILAPRNITTKFGTSLGLDVGGSQAFAYFRQSTVQEITGCFPSALWDSLILQFGHLEPTILHAMAAVGAMHFCQKRRAINNANKEPNNVHQSVALQHYVKAIGHLRKRLSGPPDRTSWEVLLMANLLFICLEILQGNRRAVLSLLRSASKILNDLSVSKQGPEESATRTISVMPTPGSLIEHLTSTFARLDCDASMFGEVRPQLHLTSSQSHRLDCLPFKFSSLEEARHHLDLLASSVLHFHRDLIPYSNTYCEPGGEDLALRLLREQLIGRHKAAEALSRDSQLANSFAQIKQRLEAWSTALICFREGSPMLSSRDGRALDLLEIKHVYFFHLHCTAAEIYETLSDRFMPLFKRTLDLVVKYLDEGETLNPQEAGFSTFSLESGILFPLYIITMKCRDSVVRRRAIQLAKRAGGQENMGDGTMIMQFIEQLVDSEEAATARYGADLRVEDVPEHARWLDSMFSDADIPGHPNCWRLVCGRYKHESNGELYIIEKFFKSGR